MSRRFEWAPGFRPLLPFQFPESSSAIAFIAEVLISSSAPEEINLGMGRGHFITLTIQTHSLIAFSICLK